MEVKVNYYYSENENPTTYCVITAEINFQTLKTSAKGFLKKDIIETIIRRHVHHKDLHFTGMAVLGNNDIYDKEFGKHLAYERAYLKYQKMIDRINRDIKKYLFDFDMKVSKDCDISSMKMFNLQKKIEEERKYSNSK